MQAKDIVDLCFRKRVKSDFWVPYVCPSTRTEQLGSHLTGFSEILYLDICRKSFRKIKDSLKSDKQNGYFT